MKKVRISETNLNIPSAKTRYSKIVLDKSSLFGHLKDMVFKTCQLNYYCIFYVLYIRSSISCIVMEMNISKELVYSISDKNDYSHELTDELITYFKNSLANIDFQIIYQILILPYTFVSLLELNGFSYYYKNKVSDVNIVLSTSIITYLCYILVLTLALSSYFSFSSIESIVLYLAIFSIFYLTSLPNNKVKPKRINEITDSIDKIISEIIKSNGSIRSERIKVQALISVKDAMLAYEKKPQKAFKALISSYFVLTKLKLISNKKDKKILKTLEAETNQILKYSALAL